MSRMITLTHRICICATTALVMAGCGGATREAWVQETSVICERLDAERRAFEASQPAVPPGDLVALADQIDKAATTLPAMMVELESVEMAKDDVTAAAWIQANRDGVNVMSTFSAALRSGDRNVIQTRYAEVEAFTERLKQATAAAGLPGVCGTEESSTATPT